MSSFQKSVGIIGVLLGNMAMGLSFSLININLESIHAQFDASIVQLQWMINIYGIFIASFLVAMGRLGDIFGRKKIYLIGIALFIIAMLGAGFAVNPGMIIVFQAIFGIAGAIILPISQAMLVDLFPEEKKGTAIGLWASSGGICLASGPLLGGIVLSFLHWRWIFLITIPFAIIGFFCTLFFAKESKTEGESTEIDWKGVGLLITTIGTFILATVQSTSWNKRLIAALFFISGLSLFVLLRLEKKVKMPIIREDLFKSRMFLFCSIGNFCMLAIFWSGIFLFPLYIQKQLHYNPLQAGLVMLGFAAPMGLFSSLVGSIYEKTGPKILTFCGFIMFSISTVMKLFYGDISSPIYIAVATTFLGIGIALIVTPTTSGALSSISKNFAGIASGTFVTIQEIGGSIGLAVTATIVREQEVFSKGFHNGMWVLLALSGIGLFSSLFIPKKFNKKGLKEIDLSKL